MHRILMVSTGGTIDKAYNESDGTFENGRSLIGEHLHHRLRLPGIELTWCALMQIDSQHMERSHRERIAETLRCESPGFDGAVVLHGTDTVDQTMSWVASTLKGPAPMPWVFSGAMKPFGYLDSDAVQNVAEALLATRLLAPGVYLAFHNQIFSVGSFRKNRERRTFEALPGKTQWRPGHGWVLSS